MASNAELEISQIDNRLAEIGARAGADTKQESLGQVGSAVKMAGAQLYYHRVIGFSIWPCTTDETAQGHEVDLYWADPAWEPPLG